MRKRKAMRTVSRRTWLLTAVAALAALVGYRVLTRFPPDTIPEGAYLRIAVALEHGEPEKAFPYLEEESQIACFTIRDYSRLAATAIAADYPEPVKAKELASYQRLAEAGEPPKVWSRFAEDSGWLRRLRRDLSGVSGVEIVGERATIITARGTRYSFRRRPNGLWGLTMFTAQLAAEARRLARDWDQVNKAASDYRAAAKER